MNQDNPYSSPSDLPDEGVDPQLLKAYAANLANSRRSPPTIASVLLRWPGPPLLVLVGVIGTAILAYLTTVEGSEITSHWPVGFGAMICGALLRDFAIARRVKRFWPAQSHFIDWEKVDEFTA